MDKFKPQHIEIPSETELEEILDGIFIPNQESVVVGEINRDLSFDSSKDRDASIVLDEAASEPSEKNEGKDVEHVLSFPSLKRTVAGDERLTLSSFVSEADEFHPDYEKLLTKVESIIEQLTAKDLLEFAGGNKKNPKLSGSEGVINSAILLKLLERYAEHKQYKNNKTFFKIVEVLRAIGKLPDYGLGEKVSIFQDSARAYYIFKKIKYILNEKSTEEIIQMVKRGRLHTAALKEVCKMYLNNKNTDVSLKNKIQIVLCGQEVYGLFYEVEDLIDRVREKGDVSVDVFKENGIDSDTLSALLSEYEMGRKFERKELNNYKKIIEEILRDPAATKLWSK